MCRPLVCFTLAFGGLTLAIASAQESSTIPESHWKSISGYDEFSEPIGKLLAKGAYDDLDELADRERAKFLETGQSPWRLGWFYDALHRAGEKRDAAPLFDYADHINKWMSARPESITAHVAQVRHLLEIAWDERGGHVAPRVTDEQWEGFHKNLRLGRATAKNALALNRIDPELSVLRLRIARHLDGDDAAGKVFDQAVGETPPYYRLYEFRARFLFPKWGGARDGSDMRKFQQKALELTRESQKSTMNLLFAQWLVDMELVKAAHIVGITWQDVETAYADAVEIASDDAEPFFLNLVCYLACNYEERDRAQAYFAKMDGGFWSHVWTAPRVNMWHAWVQGDGPKPKLNDVHRAVWDGIPGGLRQEIRIAAPGEIDAGDEYGRTPLFVAIYRVWPYAVDKLLDAGANPDIPTPSGETPLIRAIRAEQPDICAMLLDAGADPRATYTAGASAIHFAAQLGSTEMVSAILDEAPDVVDTMGDERTPLHLAVGTGHTGVVQLLLKRKANIDARGRRNATPIIVAAYTNQIGAAQVLLKHQPDLDAFDDKGWTALHAAVDSDLVDFAKLLVEAGANPNHRGKGQTTPMHVAIRSRQPASLAYLLDLDAVDINAQDKRGQTLLHSAAAAGAVSEAKVLLENGIDKTLKDAKDRTALDIAVRYKRDEIITLLK